MISNAAGGNVPPPTRTDRVYGVPRNQVVGSSAKIKYEVHDGRPLAAFGNSDGDYEMLRWTTADEGDHPGPQFGLIVHHTDAVREYAYDFPLLVGQLHRALDEAPKYGWTVVSMKDDWNTIFPAE